MPVRNACPARPRASNGSAWKGSCTSSKRRVVNVHSSPDLRRVGVPPATFPTVARAIAGNVTARFHLRPDESGPRRRSPRAARKA
jgi:hypothetical protein